MMDATAHTRTARTVRAAVYTFLTLFIVCGLARIEAWPFTGFRMFSHVRQQQQTWWSLRVVDAAGAERALPFAELEAGYQGWVHVADGFAALTEPEQIAVCRAYLGAVPGSSRIRFSRVVRDLGVRPSGVSAPSSTTLIYECDRDTVRTVTQP